MKCRCGYCGKAIEKSLGHYNRAKKMGNGLYCDRRCAGLGRRTTVEEKKEAKRLYDIEYRKKNEKRLKKIRHAWFKKDYEANPEKYKAWRKKKQKAHNEYCRQPAYAAKKKEYDQGRRAKIQYGSYGEAAIALLQLASIVDNRKAKRDQDNINKSKNVESMEKLTAKNLKNVLWQSIQAVKGGKMNYADADAIATQAREILRATHTQLRISAASNRNVPDDVIEFSESTTMLKENKKKRIGAGK
jgi:hypothetical protein